MKQVVGKANKGQESIPTLVGILMLITILACLMCPGYFCNPVWASDFSGASGFKLIASDGTADDRFGDSVAVDGDTMIVGAYEAELGLDNHQGSAYVFVRSGTNWTAQAKLTASDGTWGNNFGRSVAISGDTVVVGAPAHAVGANDCQGSAYVFVRSGTTWTEQAKLIASDGAPYTYFGVSVAITGDTVVVGAPEYDAAAYVFVRSGTTWSQQAKLTATDGTYSDKFGISVGISGETAVVGAWYDDVEDNMQQGSAYVFVRSGTTWTQQAHLNAADGAANDWFGISVAISGDTAVVGARNDDVGANTDQGSAYVFVRSGVTWSQQAHITASDGAANDNFGYSVAISGDTAVVGAYYDDVGGNMDQGSAYVFIENGNTWPERAHLTASDAAFDNFGVSVSINGNTALVGAYSDDVGANTDQGSAYIYDGSGTAQVSASVTIEAVSISVKISEGYPTAMDYGVMVPNAEAVPESYTPSTNQYLRVENSGSVAEDLLIKGADATCGTGTWILAATTAVDQYSHLYGVGQVPVTYSPLSSTLASTLGSNVAVDGTVDFNLKMKTPTSSTVFGQYSTMVTILAVAHY
jgi:hypothetical protein